MTLGAHCLPKSSKRGHMTWLATGKGRYILKRTRRPNLLPFPNPVFATPQTELVVDQTPPFIAGFAGK
jgi:hypothetical protein